MKILSDLDVSAKRVFVRADLDVSISNFQNPNSNDLESVRLHNIKPTVDWLLDHGVRQIIIAGHVGRPKQLTVNLSNSLRASSSQLTEKDNNKPEFYDESLSTRHLLPILEKIVDKSISFKDEFGENAQNQIILFENLRFWDGEAKNDAEFAQKLAKMADFYVNDAFGNCHREHASMVALPGIFAHVEDPEHSRRAAGLHLVKEVDALGGLLKHPKRPFVAIIGGAKAETKVPVIENMAKIADRVLVGGKIANELKIENGKWKIDKNKIIIAGMLGHSFDINDEAIRKFKSVISSSKTIVWNGPMGRFEEGYEKGTIGVAEAIIDSGAYSVVGGGETTEFLGSKGLLGPPAGGFSFVSSGGGAMLVFLAGKELPALEALK